MVHLAHCCTFAKIDSVWLEDIEEHHNVDGKENNLEAAEHKELWEEQHCVKAHRSPCRESQIA